MSIKALVLLDWWRGEGGDRPSKVVFLAAILGLLGRTVKEVIVGLWGRSRRKGRPDNSLAIALAKLCS